MSWVILGLVGLWLAIPSSVFVQPKALIYDGRNVTLKRDTPLGAVYAEWNRELYVVGTHLECHAPQRLERMQVVEGFTGPDGNQVAEDTLLWREGEWAMPCLTAEPPIIATYTWRVLLFGIIPLRPVSFTATIERSLEE